MKEGGREREIKCLYILCRRFEYNGLFGGKINKQIQYPEFINMRPYMSVPKVHTCMWADILSCADQIS